MSEAPKKAGNVKAGISYARNRRVIATSDGVSDDYYRHLLSPETQERLRAIEEDGVRVERQKGA
jgi:hypothetical protein